VLGSLEKDMDCKGPKKLHFFFFVWTLCMCKVSDESVEFSSSLFSGTRALVIGYSLLWELNGCAKASS
jgi:hypothetical protein